MIWVCLFKINNSIRTASSIILINGVAWPKLTVDRTKYMLRLLNGSDTRAYNIKLSNDQAFYLVATDQGFLPEPIKLTEFLLAMSSLLTLLKLNRAIFSYLILIPPLPRLLLN
jgi:FtsP/CotA-like multicopper oxidase with cupredoxin domain